MSSRLDVDTVGVLHKQETPFVLLGRPVSEYPDVSWVDTDNERYTYAAVHHLLALGHRRIGFVGGDPAVAVTGERRRGYVGALAECGIDLNSGWLDYGYFAEEGGYHAARRMLRLGDATPTAYYAANDLMAIGILRALREVGIQVPEQVSVIGTNDAPEAVHMVPSLTTLRVPYARMAARAAEILIDAIESEGPPAHGQAILECELILRSSTARHGSA